MSATIFKGALTSSFVASQVLMLNGDKAAFDFELATTGAPASIEWYMAFGDSPSTCEFREVDQTDADPETNPGAVLMPKIVRTFSELDGAGLANGTHKLSAQFQIRHAFVRLYMRVSAGACRATVTAPFGSIAS